MKCKLESFMASPFPNAAGGGFGVCRTICKTHSWTFEGPTGGSICPIGRIEEAVDAALEKIRNAVTGQAETYHPGLYRLYWEPRYEIERMVRRGRIQSFALPLRAEPKLEDTRYAKWRWPGAMRGFPKTIRHRRKATTQRTKRR